MQFSLSRFRNHAFRFVLLSGLASLNLSAQTPSAWPQFGGPFRNFTAPSKGLANAWPKEGPRKVWSRPLGEGYSGIAVDGGKLYTMYRLSASQASSKFDREVIAALDAQTGKTLWEDPYDRLSLA